MRNFQGTIFTLTRSNRDIFKSTLVYFESNKLNQWHKKKINTMTGSNVT